MIVTELSYWRKLLVGENNCVVNGPVKNQAMMMSAVKSRARCFEVGSTISTYLCATGGVYVWVCEMKGVSIE